MDKNFSVIRKFTRKFVFDTATVLNPGSSEAAKLMRKWGYKGKIEVMPILGVDTELFHPIPKINKERHFSIGYIGRLCTKKASI